MKTTKTKEFIQNMKLLYPDEFGYTEARITEVNPNPILRCKNGHFFPVAPAVALSKKFNGCPRCNTKPPAERKGGINLQKIINHTKELAPKVEKVEQVSFGEMCSHNYKRPDNFNEERENRIIFPQGF